MNLKHSLLTLLCATVAQGAFANSCPTGSKASIDEAYDAMSTRSYWVDVKKTQNTGKDMVVGIVFLNLGKDPGNKSAKSLYSHGEGVFKIDYNTSAKAKMECRRQIILDGKNSDGSFKGWLAIESCKPGSLPLVAQELDKLDSFGAKLIGKNSKVQGQPSNDEPERVLVKMDKLQFKRINDKKFGPSCLMDIVMSTTVGGSAKTYKWKLPDTNPGDHNTLTYFGNDGSRRGYRP